MVRSLRVLAPRAVYVFAGWPMKNKEVRSYKASVQRDLYLAAKVPEVEAVLALGDSMEEEERVDGRMKQNQVI